MSFLPTNFMTTVWIICIVMVILFIWLLLERPKMAIDLLESIVVGTFKLGLAIVMGLANLIQRVFKKR